MTRRAIVTSVHPYDRGLMVGSHHVAKALARRGWEVLLLIDPASLAHLLASPFNARARLRVKESRGAARTAVAGLAVHTPLTLLPLSARLGAGNAAVLRRWPSFTVPNLGRWIAGRGFEAPDLMMLDGALYAPLLESIRPKRSVLRLFDWPDGVSRLPTALRALETRLAGEVDAVAVTAHSLRPVARSWGARRIVDLPNGVESRHFAAPAPLPPEYLAIPGPRIVYMGAIAPWIDQDLMAEVAARMPDASFVWIGPGALEAGAALPNVHVLGPRPYASLPGYLQHAQAGAVPFRSGAHRDLTDRINPLKLYEYAAAGLPVVATPTAEIRRLAGPVRLAQGPAEWTAALASAIADGGPREALARFAEGNSWDARLDGLLRDLGLEDRDGGS